VAAAAGPGRRAARQPHAHLRGDGARVLHRARGSGGRPQAQRPGRSRSCRGPRRISGSTRTCTSSLWMVPGTRRGRAVLARARAPADERGRRRAREHREGHRAAPSPARSARDRRGRRRFGRPWRSRDEPRRLRRLGPDATRRAAVGERPSAARAARARLRQAAPAPRSTGSPCTRPLVRGRWTRAGARRCCATCCARRPPEERLEQRPDGLVRITLKKAYSDGTVAVDMDPLSLLLPPGHQRACAALAHRARRGRACGRQPAEAL
jgi:hypothetical protein